MEVYKFNKCLLDRLEESMLVLPWKDEIITASQVRICWASYLELNIEPAGWKAIWNIPRVICEALHVRYPTSVYGYVEQVLFKELRAVFLVEAFQDEDVNIMERHEVALEELWPTINQENDALNVERTADCLDRYRFFYGHVWMPWDKDNDDDLNWVDKHLESRIRFCYDLRKGSIKRKVAQHIRGLLSEAKYIQHRREFLELGLSDDEDSDHDQTLGSLEVTELMRLHLRLSMIRNEIEILENPEMRRIYEEVHFGENADDENDLDYHSLNGIIKRSKEELQKHCFLVTKPCILSHHIELLSKMETKIDSNCLVELAPSLLDALSKSKRHDMIFLAPGKHRLKFLEYLNEDGFMSGLSSSNNRAIISSPDTDSMLLVFNGNYTLENLTFDCSNVRTGIFIKFGGNVTLRNCRLIGDGQSSTQQGIVLTGKCKLTLINCIIEKFANGIAMQNGRTELYMKQSEITKCKIGLEISGNNTNVEIANSCISNCSKYGIFVDNLSADNLRKKWIDLDSFKELTQYSNFIGDCEFIQCKSNIHILNAKTALIEPSSLTCMQDDETDSEEFDDSLESPSIQE